MKPYSESFTAIVRYYDGNGNLTYEGFQPSGSRSLQVFVDSSTKDRSLYHDQFYRRDVTQYATGTVYYKYYGNPDGRREGPLGEIPVVVSDFPSNVYNDALGKLYDKWRAGIDLSVDAGQISQTHNMIKRATAVVNYVGSYNLLHLRQSWRSYQALRVLKKRLPRRSRKRQYLTESSSLWLEFQYGLKPLVTEVYDSAIELGRDFRPLMHIKVRARDQKSYVLPFNASGPYVTLETKVDSLDLCQFECDFSPGTSVVQLLSNFTSLNPASIAWELLPYSFVVDWFIDVGGYLRNIESSILSDSNFLKGYYTETSVTTRSVSRPNASGSDPFGSSYEYVGFSGSSYHAAKRRTVLYSSPFPRAPKLKVDLGSGRLLNAAALLGNLLRK